MKFLTSMFSDVDGQVSSKRGVLFTILLVFVYMAIGSLYGLTVKENIWDDIFYALLTFGGMVTSEKFTKRSVRNDSTPEVKP